MKGSDRLQPAIAPTIVAEPNLVRVIAGEDFRFTLRGPGLEAWLPQILEKLDGERTLDALLHGLSAERRTEALGLLERLVGERLLFMADSRPSSGAAALAPEGSGRLFEQLSQGAVVGAAQQVRVLCQDTLDYRSALEFNAACRAGPAPWLWATLGPSARAFVSPVFWPDAGPCLACLLDGFERLSPAPELYGALMAHAERGGTFGAASFPEHGIAVVARLVQWKVEMLGAPEPPLGLTRLHVVEAASMEITAHRIPRDVECRACGSGWESAPR